MTDTTSDVPLICHTPDAPVSHAGKRIVLLIAILSGFLTPFDGSAVNIALPAMAAEFLGLRYAVATHYVERDYEDVDRFLSPATVLG